MKRTISIRQIRRDSKAYAASIEAMRARSAVARVVIADRKRVARMEAKA